MDVLAWILSAALAATYLGAGLVKIIQPRSKLAQKPNFGWANDFSDANVKGIGLAEVLGAIGLIVPWATGIAPILTPIAAFGLAILQGGAMITHQRRREYKVLPANALLLIMALLVAVIRFAQPAA